MSCFHPREAGGRGKRTDVLFFSSLLNDGCIPFEVTYIYIYVLRGLHEDDCFGAFELRGWGIRWWERTTGYKEGASLLLLRECFFFLRLVFCGGRGQGGRGRNDVVRIYTYVLNAYLVFYMKEILYSNM